MVTMLKVTITNIDGPFVWVFDSDDKQDCVRRALDDLVTNHGFFKDNRVCTEFPPYLTPDAGLFGLLLMPGEDMEDKVDRDDTYAVYVSEYKPGTVITERD